MKPMTKKERGTARPWKVIRGVILSENGHLINLDSQVNVELIVRAVNSHDLLVEALERIQAIAETDTKLVINPKALKQITGEALAKVQKVA